MTRVAWAFAGDLENDPPGVSAVGGKVNVAAVLFDVGLQLFEVVVEIVQRMLLDVAGERTHLVGIGEFQDAKLPGGMLAQDGVVDRAFELFVSGGFDADGMEVELRRRRFLEKLARMRIKRAVFERGLGIADSHAADCSRVGARVSISMRRTTRRREKFVEATIARSGFENSGLIARNSSSIHPAPFPQYTGKYRFGICRMISAIDVAYASPASPFQFPVVLSCRSMS